MTEGADRCLVGRVGDDFKEFFNRLEGRIAQVVENYAVSSSIPKRRFSTLHDGICHAMLVDKAMVGDIEMNKCLTMIESDEEEEE